MTLLDEPVVRDDSRARARYRYEWMICLLVAISIVAGVTIAILLMAGAP